MIEYAEGPIRWWQWLRRRRCPHSRLLGIYGDSVNHVGGWRLQCRDCRQFLNGPVSLSKLRVNESEAWS